MKKIIVLYICAKGKLIRALNTNFRKLWRMRQNHRLGWS